MQRLPEHVLQLLRDLGERPSLIDRLGLRTDSRVQAIRALGATGLIDVVPHLVAFIFESAELATEAIDAIDLLMVAASDEQLLQLDEQIRSELPWWASRTLRGVPYTVLQLTEDSNRNLATIYGVLSCHPNGHVREAAVRVLSGIRDGSELPYLLIRLNDWVAQVRDVCAAAVQTRLQEHSLSHFFKHMLLVFRLEQCRRNDNGAIVRAVVEQLALPESSPHLSECLGDSCRFTRRHAYSAVMSVNHANRVSIIQHALCNQDGVLRLWAVRDAKATLNDEELRTALPRALVDRFRPVRREALTCVIARFPGDANDRLIDALLDTNYSIRDFAQYHLRKRSDFDVARYYRDCLTHGECISQTVAGLGECGCADDLPLIAPFSRDTHASVRAAAVRSVGKLGAAPYTSILVAALADDNKRVSNEACKALSQMNSGLPLSEIVDLFRGATRTHVALRALELIDANDTWASLPYLLEAAASTNAEVAMVARGDIQAKYNRVFTVPNGKQRRAALDAVNENAATLPATFVLEIKQWIDLRK